MSDFHPSYIKTLPSLYLPSPVTFCEGSLYEAAAGDILPSGDLFSPVMLSDAGNEGTMR